MDVIELNEAFSAQALACIRALGLKDDDARINPNGGAIAIGHPLGVSGTRIIQTAALELTKTKQTLCSLHHVYWSWARLCNHYRTCLIFKNE
jgi:acetyl-CoA acetyltransferase